VSFGGRLGYEDAGNTANTQVVLHDYPQAPLIFETRGLPKAKGAGSMDDFRGSQIGVIVQCENGHVLCTSRYDHVAAFDRDGKEIESFDGAGEHMANFLDAVRSRKRGDLYADVLEGHLSSALCHTGGISHQLGEPQPASDILAPIKDNALLHDSVERMFAHLRANEVDIDGPVVTQGVWLEMDPAKERFTNNDAANEMLRREDRPAFAVPQVA
jgi:hypothetical protein